MIADRVKRRDRLVARHRLRGKPRPDEVQRSDEVLELLGLRDLSDEPIERLSLGQGRLVEVPGR